MNRKEAPYLCTFEGCAATFARSDRLEIHFRTHTGERPFACEYEGCDKSYISSSHLKRHEAIHESTYKCTFEGCFEILKTKATLRKHIDNFHHKKKHKLYKCKECDKEFNKHNWLQSHMYKHTGAYPYECEIDGCKRGFLTPSKLRRHMKVHEGHKCKIPGCEKVFKKWSLYVTHLKESHPKVYECGICNRKFNFMCNLKAHCAVHEEPRKVYPCEMPNCTRFYYAEKNLNWHMKSYHEARTHACEKEHCQRTFKTENALEYHKLCHIRRKPRKKKKPRPDFSAVLSGCADPRKFTRKMPPKPITSESSDEFTTDEEIVYQDESAEESSHKNSQSEGTDSDCHVAGNEAGPSQSSKNSSLNHVRSESIDINLKTNEEVLVMEDPEINSHLGDSEVLATSNEEYSATLPNTPVSSLDQRSNSEPPWKRPRFETSEKEFNFYEEHPQSNSLVEMITTEEHAAVEKGYATFHDNLKALRKSSKSEEEGTSSSEYETITVSIFGNINDKSLSENEDLSSCQSEAEDLVHFNNMYARER